MLPWFLFHPVALARKLFLNSSSKVNFNMAVVSGRIRSSIACLLITDPDNNDISCDQDSYVFFFFDTIIIKPHIKFFALTLPSLRFQTPGYRLLPLVLQFYYPQQWQPFRNILYASARKYHLPTWL